MMDNLVSACDASCRELDWTDGEIQGQALDKCSKFNPKIGYPEEWEDYPHLDINRVKIW